MDFFLIYSIFFSGAQPNLHFNLLFRWTVILIILSFILKLIKHVFLERNMKTSENT